MRNAYVTKRIAPSGYFAVTRKLAEVLYDEDYPVTVCGNNVNSYHVFNGWGIGSTYQKSRCYGYGLALLVNTFMSYLDKELGTYPVFYVRKEVIGNMDLSILTTKE